MIYKVGLLGATGRVGLEIASLLSCPNLDDRHDLELAECVAASDKIASIEGVSVRTLKETPRENVHVWIDFSRPEATLKLLEQINCPVVIGTTGFSEGEIEMLRKRSENLAVLWTPNVSPGILAIKKMLGLVPKLSYDVVLHESHHKHKKDAPSGTSRMLLKELSQHGFNSVDVQVTRAGSLLGSHKISFISEGEELILSHQVLDRKIYAIGAIQAARYLVGKKAGWYQLDDVYNAMVNNGS